MKRDYLGDSYDAVKRMWHDLLAPDSPLVAEPCFVPAELRGDYTRITLIDVQDRGSRPDRHALLNDPDTGIRLPTSANQSESIRHIAIATIVEQLKDSRVTCVITFDQSQHRMPGSPARSQRRTKLDALSAAGCYGFYYRSHAPFLFAFKSARHMQRVKARILEAGIPTSRIEVADEA